MVAIHGRAMAGQPRLDIPNRNRPWGEKSSRKWKTPSVILGMKSKSLPLVFAVHIPDLKCREIFTQANHPFQRHLKRIGRAATVLVKAYTDTFVTLQLSDPNHLIHSFLIPAREECASTGVAMGGFELDVERMFPSVPRHCVMNAWEDLAQRYATMGNTKRVGGNDIYGFTGKGGNRKLDCMGQKSDRDYWVYTITEIHETLRFELHMNDLYTMGGDIGRQATGVAIGGFPSSAHADVTLMHAESNVAWVTELGEDLRISRFRDRDPDGSYEEEAGGDI